MAIPGFQDLLLPALRYVANHDNCGSLEIVKALQTSSKLSDADLAIRLRSGVQSIFENRVYWALTYLVKAGLLMRPSRGRFSTTQTWRKVVAKPPNRIDIRFLRQFESFRAFRALHRAKTPSAGSAEDSSGAASAESPAEELDRGYGAMRDAVIDDLLEIVRALPDERFERLVVELLQKMGYGSVVHTGRPGDGGIDGEISQDRLGLDMVYVQAKRYAENQAVGRPALQQFVGSLNERKANKGIFVTTSRFADTADEYVSKVNVKIVLIDGERLADLMYEHGLGVETQRVLEIKRLDRDYFESE